MRRINSSNSSEKDVISLAFIALFYFAYWMYILFDSKAFTDFRLYLSARQLNKKKLGRLIPNEGPI